MKKHDVIVIGGGLAGLSAAAALAQHGFSVLVLERDEYPRHKVCGEYVGNESRSFLQRLGLEVPFDALPQIHRLQVSDPQGKTLHASLPTGGFGISRYALDAALARLAVSSGAGLQTGFKVDGVRREGKGFAVQAGGTEHHARLLLGAWGKRANLDSQLHRPHMRGAHPQLDGWVGVKHHIRTDHADDLIALHNFEGGYCGISRVEGDVVCLCYLVRGGVLKRAGNIAAMEAEILSRNPHLSHIWRSAEFLFEKPLAISQVSFQQRSTGENGILMLGDAAGLIAPLCGNGMSMAFGAAQLAHQVAGAFLKGEISAQEMHTAYKDAWRRRFGLRLRVGRAIQAHFGSPRLTTVLVSTLRHLPFLKAPLIRATHGRQF